MKQCQFKKKLAGASRVTGVHTAGARHKGHQGVTQLKLQK